MKIQTPPILRGMDAIDSCVTEGQLAVAARYSELAFRLSGQNLSPPVRGVFKEMTHAKLRAAARRLCAQSWQRDNREANAA